MEGGFLLNIVIGQGTSVFKLLSSEDQTLLIWRDSLLVLNLRFDVVNRVGGFHLKGDGFSSDYGRIIRINLFNSPKKRKKERRKKEKKEKQG